METPCKNSQHCRASALTLLPGVSPGFGRRGDIIFTTWPPGLESPRTRRVFRVAAFLIRNFFSVISGLLAAGAAGGKQVLALPISTRTSQFFPSAKRGCFPAAFIDEAMRTSLGVVEAFVSNAWLTVRSLCQAPTQITLFTFPPGHQRAASAVELALGGDALPQKSPNRCVGRPPQGAGNNISLTGTTTPTHTAWACPLN